MVPVKLAIDAWFAAAGLNPACFADGFGKAPQQDDYESQKILLVDDDRVFQYALSLKLNAKGYEADQGPGRLSGCQCHTPAQARSDLLDMNFPPNVEPPSTMDSASWNG
jgi:hypothetical protein